MIIKFDLSVVDIEYHKHSKRGYFVMIFGYVEWAEAPSLPIPSFAADYLNYRVCVWMEFDTWYSETCL